jgi:hypothetical protein
MLFNYIFALSLLSQNPSGCLCKKNEKIVFSFLTQNNKIVSVCSEKKDKYMVYRFGTQAKTELQYPVVLDESSWQKFELYSYFRGGGKENAGIDENHLSFTNDDIKYEIFEDYSALDNRIDLGVIVETPQFSIKVKGLIKTKKGDLKSIEGKVPKSDF